VWAGGSELATSLRQHGYADSVVADRRRDYVPYRRPPLSKTDLSGEVTLESFVLKPRAVYENMDECRFGIGWRVLIALPFPAPL